ncbi:MAG TPA: nitronate monooxygenase [Ignavibacteria bacterium]|nr:nitronate monooxygenase [Ignavibacteria bacterium]
MNRITELFKIKYPIIQAGMVWCSGYKLASAVSNSGGLGLLGAGSMTPDLLEYHITKCKEATGKPFGVNLPLLYSHTEEHLEIILRTGVKIVFTSAGNPAKYTSLLKKSGITVVHVIANKKFAQKAMDAGVDALVAEGFEAGGHDGVEETTTMVLIPLIREIVNLPLLAAGGISSGRAMLAAMALGADGVQIGSLFAASEESSAHINFKKKIIESGDGETALVLKKLVPVRMLKNKFYDKIQQAESRGAERDELSVLLGRGRSRLGIFEGNLDDGELEIGQVSALVKDIKPASEIMKDIISEYNSVRIKISNEENKL